MANTKSSSKSNKINKSKDDNKVNNNKSSNKKSKVQVVRQIMLKRVDLKELNQKIDQAYKENNNKIRFLVIIITVLVILLILLSYKMGSIGYSPVAFSEVDNITLKEENAIINHNARINVFGANKTEETHLIDGFRVIYPSVKGEYKFSVKNDTLSNMKYNIDFNENATAPINMKFRLKLDNIYVKGSSEQYVDLDLINLTDIVVPSNSINIYTLEWCWVEDETKDSQVAEMTNIDKQYYTISMRITSSPYFN